MSHEKTLLPIFVDEADDLICYLSIPCDKQEDNWKFQVPNGSGLKIHTSLYDLVGAEDRSKVILLAHNSLVVQFRPEFFDANFKPGEEYENDTAGHVPRPPCEPSPLFRRSIRALLLDCAIHAGVLPHRAGGR